MQPARKSRHDDIQNATGAGRAPAPAALHTSRGNAAGIEIQRVSAEGARRVGDELQANSQVSGIRHGKRPCHQRRNISAQNLV